MNYELSAGALFFGILIVVVGAVFLRFHQWVADNFGAGVASYDQYKLYAIITTVFGILMMVNLPGYILGLVLGSLFSQL